MRVLLLLVLLLGCCGCEYHDANLMIEELEAQKVEGMEKKSALQKQLANPESIKVDNTGLRKERERLQEEFLEKRAQITERMEKAGWKLCETDSLKILYYRDAESVDERALSLTLAELYMGEWIERQIVIYPAEQKYATPGSDYKSELKMVFDASGAKALTKLANSLLADAKN